MEAMVSNLKTSIRNYMYQNNSMYVYIIICSVYNQAIAIEPHERSLIRDRKRSRTRNPKIPSRISFGVSGIGIIGIPRFENSQGTPRYFSLSSHCKVCHLKKIHTVHAVDNIQRHQCQTTSQRKQF